MIRVNSTGNHESTSKDLPTVQKSIDSIVQIERSMKAISGETVAKSPELRLQIRPTSDEINETSTTGESSPGQGVHLTEISDHFDGKISGDIKSGKDTGAPVDNVNEGSHQMNPDAEDNLLKVREHLNHQQHINVGSSNLQDQSIANDVDHHKGDEGETVRMTSVLNQGHNQDNEHLANQIMQPLQQHQEKFLTMDFTDGKLQGKMQVNQEIATKGTQEAQLANDEVHSGISNDKQHGNGEKTK
ncbi:hypothetical protein KY284_026444 [Solanum tuberosum]|nr:hypothetical protein KY284_026444 [Solanum tuberosum]